MIYHLTQHTHQSQANTCLLNILLLEEAEFRQSHAASRQKNPLK